ncbi:hypothetical protein Hamer_G025409 [Homarus americanus]|uniref:Uncharacterized protein n=1 Tax=Homarus americanus TaxID=6706 RepID=A0A8J5KFI4_HOMAM|nr:hypothetical protein Hamer_G025409 [Homarus americanus]
MDQLLLILAVAARPRAVTVRPKNGPSKATERSHLVVEHASDQWRSLGSEQGTDHCLVDGVFTRNCHTVVTGQCVVDCWARGSWLLDRRVGNGRPLCCVFWPLG